MDAYQENAHLGIVYKGDVPVAGGILFDFKGKYPFLGHPPFPNTISRVRTCSCIGVCHERELHILAELY